MNPKVSILVPSYNSEKFISQCIDSVLNQSFDDWEMICSDNCSTDKTWDILKEYSKKDSRIKAYQNESNIGPSLNWKKCLDKAKGDFVHWLWSDDWVEDNFYVDMMSLIKKDNSEAATSWNYRRDPGLEKYLSWQCSIEKLPGKIAAKKILTSSRELPVSPAAYILPTKLVKKHFYMNIPSFANIDPVSYGVGVDSLMVAGTCMDIKYLSVLQRPSVNFRKHNNISTKLSKRGVLGSMYFISHGWFLSENKINLNIRNIICLLRMYILVYKFSFPLRVINNKSIISSLFKISNYKKDTNYVSVKVVFKS